MSRGGRGGRGGGYGGAPGARLNHGTMPFEISPELLAHVEGMNKESGLFPHMNVPKSKPLSREELHTIDSYRELRAKRQLGPYYLPSSARDSNNRRSKRLKTGRDERALYNAFEDQKTYLAMQEDIRRAFKEADYSKLPFTKDLLPKELWGVCGLAEGTQYWPNMRGDKKSLLSMGQKLARIDDVDDADDDAVDKDADEDLDGSDKDVNEDGEKDEDAASDQDDDFEDGEDDMAADYNAEQYFDGGEDDGDDLGGGDGGGGDDW